MENPDILVGTPCRVLEHINAKNIDLSQSVEMVVIDEADLIFSFGYEKNMKALLGYVVHCHLLKLHFKFVYCVITLAERLCMETSIAVVRYFLVRYVIWFFYDSTSWPFESLQTNSIFL